MARRRIRVIGEWRQDAACLEVGTMTAAERISLFFPERSQTDIARAKAVCQTCSVRTECLDEAIENRERFGVWGGMDTQERQKEARRRRIAAHQVLVSSCETPEGDGD